MEPELKQDPELRKRVTIFSVYPEPLRTITRGRNQPRSEWPMDAGTPDKPALLVVEDQRESVYAGEDSQGGRMYDMRPILAMRLAKDLVNEWRDLIPNSAQGRRIGIGIADGDAPTKDEIAVAVAEQSAFFSALVAEARQHHSDGHSHLIRTKHRVAARFLKLTGEPWLNGQFMPGQRKNCPLCRSEIMADATVCPNCGRNIAPMPEEYAKLNRIPVTAQLPGNRPAA